MTLIDAERLTWQAVCRLDALIPGRGVAALVEGTAVAVFRLDDADSVRAIDNLDPCSGASVLSRGLTGQTDLGEGPVRYVASPIRKQRFDLDTGRCLDVDVAVATWAARVVDGVVEVAREASPPSNGPETTP